MDRPDVLLAVRDLFFRVKLETMLRRLNLDFVDSAGRALSEAALADRPRVVVLDVQDPALDALAEVRRLREEPATADVPVVAFAAHGETDLRARALAAGCSTVVSRGRLSAALPEVLDPWLPARA